MRGNRVRRCFTGRSLAAAVACSAAMSGCVMPIPYSKSVPLPDVESRLPGDIRESTHQLLVIKQVTSSSESKAALDTSTRPASIVTADLMKGNEFLAFARTLKVDSSSGIALCIFALAAGGCGPISGVSSKLDKLCVVTEDGRLILLVGPGALQQLDTRRRDAIVSALRGKGNSPFSEVDGPCGVSGDIEWSEEQRSRVITFLAAVPDIPPGTGVNGVLLPK